MSVFENVSVFVKISKLEVEVWSSICKQTLRFYDSSLSPSLFVSCWQQPFHVFNNFYSFTIDSIVINDSQYFFVPIEIVSRLNLLSSHRQSFGHSELFLQITQSTTVLEVQSRCQTSARSQISSCRIPPFRRLARSRWTQNSILQTIYISFEDAFSFLK